MQGNTNGWTIESNEIRGVGIFDSDYDAINLVGAISSGTIAEPHHQQHGPGVDGANNAEPVIENNTVTGNASARAGAVRHRVPQPGGHRRHRIIRQQRRSVFTSVAAPT
jgi:hypothetical protein